MATAVVLDGSRDGDELATTREALVQVLDGRGFESTVLALRDMRLAPCMGCFGCWAKTPGVCAIDDDARMVAATMVRSDLIVYLTPVTFGGYSSVLKRALDRHICVALPFFVIRHGEIHHPKRYAHNAPVAVLGVLPHPDAEAEEIFGALVERNARNSLAPGFRSTVVYAGQNASEVLAAADRLLGALEVKA